VSFRMHKYQDDLTGLAAFCDVCYEQITNDEGYIVWNPDDVDDWLLVHQVRCDPGGRQGSRYTCSMPLDVEIVYLANSVGVNLQAAKKRVGTFSMLG
jgi:hypothetical protein